jgi:hypothetical protein
LTHLFGNKSESMTSLNLLERELLGSARTIIDANSNRPLTQSIQPSTYRTSYGITSQLPCTSTTSSYYNLGYGNCSPENHESKKALNDVNNHCY